MNWSSLSGALKLNPRQAETTSAITFSPTFLKKHKHAILGIFNKSLREAFIPKERRDSNILPILKPGKDAKSPASYRPISLLLCITKLVERLITCRLQWYMEKHKCFSRNQFGFRQARSTIDPLLLLELNIQLSFRKRETTLVVCFDKMSAFDRADPIPKLYKLSEVGISGNILRWLKEYLTNSRFRVRIEETSSKSFDIIH